MSKFWKSILIAFIIFQFFILVIVAIKMAIFFMNNPPALYEKKHLVKLFFYRLVFNLMDMWSEIMFWILFFTSLYWFVAYKISSNVAVVMPSYDEWNNNYIVFYIVFGLVLLLRVIVTILKIIEQSSVDIFLIDWETPKDYL
jgi:hypothetical protein